MPPGHIRGTQIAALRKPVAHSMASIKFTGSVTLKFTAHGQIADATLAAVPSAAITVILEKLGSSQYLTWPHNRPSTFVTRNGNTDTWSSDGGSTVKQLVAAAI